MGKFNSSSLNIKSSANWDFSIARLVYSGAPLTSGSHKSHRSESSRVSGLDHHHFSQAIPPFHHVRIRKNSSNNSSLGYPKINQNHPFHSDFPFKNSTKNQITTSSRFFPRLEAPWDWPRATGTPPRPCAARCPRRARHGVPGDDDAGATTRGDHEGPHPWRDLAQLVVH